MGSASFIAFAKRDAFPTGLVESAPATEWSRRTWEQGYGTWPDAETAMSLLGDQDRYENGSMSPDNVGGKMDLVHIAEVDDQDMASDLAGKLIMSNDERICDKYGPAGCITIRNGENQFLFFGFVAT